MDLSNLKSTFDKESIEKNKKALITDLKNQKEKLNSVGIDIDKQREVVLNIFRVKTEKQTKPFYKIAKKNNPNQTLKFTKSNLKPYWISILETESHYKDLRDILEDDFYTYLTGLFIVIHSRNLSSVIHLIVDSIFIEMFMNSAKKVTEREK
jgi:hypothetical protein